MAEPGPPRIRPRRLLILVLIALALIIGAGRIAAVRGQTPQPTPFNPNTGPVVRVSYPPGWNLVSAPAGAPLPPSSRPIYTYAAGGYQTVDPSSTQPGVGYWAYYDAVTSQSFPGGGPETFTLPIPAGQWIMIGNPRGSLVVVTGADAVYIYDPVQGYETTTVLEPGQGAWAFSYSGGTL